MKPQTLEYKFNKEDFCALDYIGLPFVVNGLPIGLISYESYENNNEIVLIIRLFRKMVKLETNIIVKNDVKEVLDVELRLKHNSINNENKSKISSAEEYLK